MILSIAEIDIDMNLKSHEPYNPFFNARILPRLLIILGRLEGSRH